MSRGVKLRHGYYTVLVGEHDDLYHIFLQKFKRLKNKFRTNLEVFLFGFYL